MTTADRASGAHDALRLSRRHAAIVAAEELFGAQGFHATAMTEVAARAGISLKALYECLPSKEALFALVLDDVADRFAVLFPVLATDDEDPVGQLLRFVSSFVELLAANTAALRLYSRGSDVVPVALRARGIDPFAAYRERLEAAITAVVRRAQDETRADGLAADVIGRSLVTITVAESRRRLDAGALIADGADDVRAVVLALLAPH